MNRIPDAVGAPSGSLVHDDGSDIDDSRQIDRHGRQERTLSVRVPEKTAQMLMGLSLIDQVTLAETIRRGLAEYLEIRRESAEFESELAAARQRQLAALNQLGTT